MSQVQQDFGRACEIYREPGADPEKVISKSKTIPVPLHAWQGDDVVGFENFETAHTGTKRVCLQGHQMDQMLPGVKRNGFTTENFSSRLDRAGEKKIGMDIAPCFYSHPKLDHGSSLSHPDAEIRAYEEKSLLSSNNIR